MRKILSSVVVCGICLSFSVFQGCDWDGSGGESFNTSRGGGVNINFSGYYRPKSGGFLVPNNVTHIVLTQIGNSIEVYDNNNSYYTGSVGSPGVMANQNINTGEYPAGAEMLQAQVSFSGKNAGTGQDVSFVGIIHVVAVDHVVGDSTTYSDVYVDDTYVGTSTNNTGTTSIDISAPPVTIGDQTITTSDSRDTTQDTRTRVDNTTRTYELTEENSQYVLDGNWIEGGAVTGIGAIAPSTASTFTTD